MPALVWVDLQFTLDT